MSTTTLHLPYVRFVRQVSNGCARSKYSFKGMMAENLEALKAEPWRLARCLPNEVTTTVNAIAATDKVTAEGGSVTAEASYTQYMEDCYDAFMQGGDASRETATMCGYAGMVAYRFAAPYSSHHDLAGAISNVTLPLLRDRYCRSGVRVAIVISSDATPSDDWDTIRGETSGTGRAVSDSTPAEGVDGVTSWGALAQPDVPYLLASATAYDTLSFDFANFSLCEKYIWVYLTLEDYCGYWSLYDKSTPRYYSIEGSAKLDAQDAFFTFGGTVEPDGTIWHESDVRTSPFDVFNAATFTDAQMAAYGNLLKCVPRSAVYTHQSAIAALEKLDLLPGKAMHSDDLDTTSTTRIPAADVGVLACHGMTFSQNGATHTPDGGVGRGDLAMLISEPSFGDTSSLVGSDGTVEVNGTAELYYSMRVVPHDAPFYTKMRIAVDAEDELVSLAPGYDFDVLVWKVTGAAFFGAYSTAALVALAKNPAFFTGTKRTISGTFESDGTSRFSVFASATLLQRVEIDFGSLPGTIDVRLRHSVGAGDVLALVPCFRSVTEDFANGGTCSLGTPVVSFAE